MPKGVSIPPRFAARVCRVKVTGISFLLPVESSTKKLRGRKVSRAMSLAIIMEPIYVINISAVTAERTVCRESTILRARLLKKLMFLSADITARVQKRQESVERSKY